MRLLRVPFATNALFKKNRTMKIHNQLMPHLQSQMPCTSVVKSVNLNFVTFGVSITNQSIYLYFWSQRVSIWNMVGHIISHYHLVLMDICAAKAPPVQITTINSERFLVNKKKEMLAIIIKSVSCFVFFFLQPWHSF